MQLVGIKELKDKFSYYVGLTKEGDNIIVTDRGVPVAILHSFDIIEEKAGIEERLAYLAKKGKIRLPLKRGKLTPFDALKVKGRPASRIVIEDRK